MIKTEVSSFPDVYNDISLDLLLQAYINGPTRVEKVICDLKLGELKARPRPDKWSILEIVLHLVDSELVGAVRIKKVFSEPGADLPFYDQDQWAYKLEYQNSSLEEIAQSLSLFKYLRQSVAKSLVSLSEEDWYKTGNHAEFGEVTLRNLLELYADHSERHIKQIIDIRRLIGIPKRMEMILKNRLY